MKIKVKELRILVEKCVRTKYDEQDTQRIAEIIMFGQMSGKTTHGLVRLLVGKSVLSATPEEKPQIKQITGVSALIDGRGNPGMLVGVLAMEEVIRLAKQNGFGLVGTRRSVSSSGSLTYYLEQIAKNNLIGMIMAQSPASTPPHGGTEPMFGTNPISFGFPGKLRPVIFDMGTSAISFGAILKAKATGTQLPEGVALDSLGQPTTDPNKAAEGATLPFDKSYKGAGLAMVVEIMSGLWPGADFSGLNPEGGWGNTFIAFSPTLLSGTESFKSNVSAMAEKIRNSKSKSGGKIRIPGEYALNTRDTALESGETEAEDELVDLANRYLKTGQL